MRKTSIVVALVASATVSAAPKPEKLAVEAFELANGMRVAFVRVDTAPVVAVQVWYRAGSKDEPRDRRGSARLLEHVMFKGSDHVRADAHAQLLTAVGGVVHAQTDEDSTHYIDTLPADYLDLALQLEADRMRHLMLRTAATDVEREIAKDEIRQQEASPITRAYLRFLQIEFTKHPYSWTSNGFPADLDRTTVENLRAFYDAYYQPNNAMLVVVGKATLDQVKAAAEKHFAAIPKAADPPRPAAAAAEPEQTAKRREVVEPGQIGLAIVGWHIPAARDKDVYALQVASMLLGVGDASRIKARLKTVDPKSKQPLALDGGMEAIVREDPGVALALGAFLQADRADAIEAAILDEVTKLGAKGPDATELRKAKNRIEAGFTFSLEHAQGLAEAIGRSWILTGDPGRFVRDLDEVEKVSAGDVQRVVKKYFAAERATTIVIPPKAPPPQPPAPTPTPTPTPKETK
jgi:zinc protease